MEVVASNSNPKSWAESVYQISWETSVSQIMYFPFTFYKVVRYLVYGALVYFICMQGKRYASPCMCAVKCERECMVHVRRVLDSACDWLSEVVCCCMLIKGVSEWKSVQII